jgi:flagellin-specific chaperone FliS
LIYAQLKDDTAAVAEVVSLIKPLAQSWWQATGGPVAAGV